MKMANSLISPKAHRKRLSTSHRRRSSLSEGRNRTIKFYTLGCKANQYDTQAIREKFLALGFSETDKAMNADTYLINTCTVTQRADSESLSLIRRARRENAQAEIIVTGCLAELNKETVKKVDKSALIIRNRDKENILQKLVLGGGGKPVEAIKFPQKGISYFQGHTRAFLKIQDGCDNFCSYCRVPFARGNSRSRPLKEVIQEAQRLAQNGYKEIVLTGICLGSYGKDLQPKSNLTRVISALERMEGILRIRLSSIEAGDVSDELIDTMARSEKLCRHLHIPMQSGDDGILRGMNRAYSRSSYIALVNKIKQRIPEIAITTDVLVGFPGETEAGFQNTRRLIEEIIPLKVHIFPYSRRKGTRAYALEHMIHKNKIRERCVLLKRTAELCAFTYTKRFLNKKMEVLIEGRSKDNPAFWEGYTQNYIKVLVPSEEDLANTFIPLILKKIAKDKVIADFH